MSSYREIPTFRVVATEDKRWISVEQMGFPGVSPLKFPILRGQEGFVRFLRGYLFWKIIFVPHCFDLSDEEKELVDISAPWAIDGIIANPRVTAINFDMVGANKFLSYAFEKLVSNTTITSVLFECITQDEHPSPESVDAFFSQNTSVKEIEMSLWRHADGFPPHFVHAVKKNKTISRFKFDDTHFKL